MQDNSFGGYKILSTAPCDEYSEANSCNMKIAVLIHLYYQDTIHDYIKYIVNIPSFCTKIFTYSDEETLRIIKEELSKNNCEENCIFIKKENRGRDISALLVAAREELLKYDLICFVHDKKAVSAYKSKDFNIWINTMWENTLGSKGYILNVINSFHQDNTLGVLFPPHPYGNTTVLGLCDSWTVNLQNTQKLAKKLGLNIIPSENMESCAVGTVFWARSDALSKLLNYTWNYSDFDDEPLPRDGSLSHAIERILRFVSMDAGYKEYFCLSNRFTEKYLSELHSFIQDESHLLKEELEINGQDVHYYESWKSKFWENISKYEHVYLYGAGHFGRQCLNFMARAGKNPDGFLVSHSVKNDESINGIGVYNFDEFDFPENSCIVITVERDNSKRIIENIQKKFGKNSMKNIFFYQTM